MIVDIIFDIRRAKRKIRHPNLQEYPDDKAKVIKKLLSAACDILTVAHNKASKHCTEMLGGREEMYKVMTKRGRLTLTPEESDDMAWAISLIDDLERNDRLKWLTKDEMRHVDIIREMRDQRKPLREWQVFKIRDIYDQRRSPSAENANDKIADNLS